MPLLYQNYGWTASGGRRALIINFEITRKRRGHGPRGTLNRFKRLCNSGSRIYVFLFDFFLLGTCKNSI